LEGASTTREGNTDVELVLKEETANDAQAEHSRDERSRGCAGCIKGIYVDPY
jgi:hypothetical protein